MPGAVDAAANLVDISGSPANGGGQFLLLGVVHFDDVTVNRHLAEICTHVPGAELRHLVLDEPPLLLGDAELDADRSCAFSHWIFASSNYNGQFFADWGDTRKNIPFHISTDNFGQKLGTRSEKNSLSLYNGHFIRRLAGKAGIKFPSRKVPPNLQRTLFRLNAGMAAKYF